jgi:hypothetical protein
MKGMEYFGSEVSRAANVDPSLVSDDTSLERIRWVAGWVNG